MARINFNLQQHQEHSSSKVGASSSTDKHKHDSQRFNDQAMSPSTLANSIKDRYVIRSQHDKIGALKFMPTNARDAKSEIKTECVHSLGDTFVANESKIKEQSKLSSYVRKESAVSHDRSFKATSPITQCVFKEKP